MSVLKNPARHDDLLNYQLKRLVTLGGAPAVRLCEGGYGIARQEWRLLAALAEEGPMTIGALFVRVQLEPGRVSRLLKELVRKGLVERIPQGGDRRRDLLRVSAAGEGLYRALLPRLAAVNRRLMEVLSEEEALLLEDFLARLTRQARAIHDEGGEVEVKTGRHLGSGRRRPALWNGAPPRCASPLPSRPD